MRGLGTRKVEIRIDSNGISAFDLVYIITCFRGSCRSFCDGNSYRAITGLFATLMLCLFKILAIGSVMHFICGWTSICQIQTNLQLTSGGATESP